MWNLYSSAITAGSTEANVWLIDASSSANSLPVLHSILSREEKDRADSFLLDRDRHRFIFFRGTLRTILAHLVCCAPDELQFDYTAFGKPFIAASCLGEGLHFNISHSDELGLVAVIRERRIGVDIEMIRPALTGDDLAERFFSPPEVKQLRNLSGPAQAAFFFSCWTRREAYAKALGIGLSQSFGVSDMPVEPGQPNELKNVEEWGKRHENWYLQELEVGGPFRAALAVEGPLAVVRCWRWEGVPAGERFPNSSPMLIPPRPDPTELR